MKFLNDKWLNMNKETAYRKILRLTKKAQIRNLRRYLDKVKYKWFIKTKICKYVSYVSNGDGLQL
jgi:hypothetical protein